MIIPDYVLSRFYGLNTNIKDTKTLKPGISPSSLNWITGGKEGDHIELRRGQAPLGQTRNIDINGKVTGLGVGVRYDGVEIPFFSYGRKIKYYDEATDDTIEVGSDLLPVEASGEDIWFRPYQNLAGSLIYLGSPNSNIYKIPVANPANAVNQNVIDYRWGVFHIGQNRGFAGQRNGITFGNEDKTGAYVSHADKVHVGDYTFIKNEILGSGDGSTKAFSGTSLAEIKNEKTLMYPMIGAPIQAGTSISAITKAARAVVTSNSHGLVAGDQVMILGVVGMTEANGIIASVASVTDVNTIVVSFSSQTFTTYSSGGTIYKIERFKDDRNGNLLSNLGGTGTVNYATGAWSITFNTAPINLSSSVITNYLYESSTTGGILDFVEGTEAALGQRYEQADGTGNLMAIFSLNNYYYCFHKLKTYQLYQSSDDTIKSDNLPYRNIGISYPRAAFQTPDGIIFADLARPTDPKFRRLEVLQGTSNTTIEPKSLSDALDLSPYDFDYCVAFRWGDYEIFCVQEKTASVSNTFNSLMFVRNVLSGAWDVLDYYASNLAEYMGTLIAGDSISNNVFTLFSGFDDDGDIITNHWTTSDLNLNTDNLKVLNFMEIDGLIQKDQSLKVSLSYDGGAFSEIYTILGSGAYVDSGINTTIGSSTLGSKVLGGGGEITAHPFELRFPVHSDRFIFVRVKVEALGIGHCAVNSFKFVDIRDKGSKNLPVRTI